MTSCDVCSAIYVVIILIIRIITIIKIITAIQTLEARGATRHGVPYYLGTVAGLAAGSWIHDPLHSFPPVLTMYTLLCSELCSAAQASPRAAVQSGIGRRHV
ncbi:unnamed protein product [Prorocentrum cordatum]|uniref:Uncharacterized protein n=1 Tax=Prorocentrum cordatum TaxID=2364126 RepID=A0ABN9UXN9_9DINO|nr:unnamed protein product [Polarella glacialis]